MDHGFSAFDALCSGTSFKRTLPKAKPPKAQSQGVKKKPSADLDFFAAVGGGGGPKAATLSPDAAVPASKKRKVYHSHLKK
jgi:hypothetical protein